MGTLRDPLPLGWPLLLDRELFLDCMSTKGFQIGASQIYSCLGSQSSSKTTGTILKPHPGEYKNDIHFGYFR